ncbi:mRNA binding Pumilio-homology domain protein, putative, partial [Hepatocystis sp. ex Piliocolobus tephrosceles]
MVRKQKFADKKKNNVQKDKINKENTIRDKKKNKKWKKEKNNHSSLDKKTKETKRKQIEKKYNNNYIDKKEKESSFLKNQAPNEFTNKKQKTKRDNDIKFKQNNKYKPKTSDKHKLKTSDKHKPKTSDKYKPKTSDKYRLKKNDKFKFKKNDKDQEIINQKCKDIMKNENLSNSKKKKLIKECRKKSVVENYDLYKELKINLNDMLQTKNKLEKEKKINDMYAQLKKIKLINFSRTNLGFHILSALFINGNEEMQKKIWKQFHEHLTDICAFNFVSILIQSFYKHSKGFKIKNDIYLWLLNNTKSFLSKFAAKLWNVVFKNCQTQKRRKMINYLLIPNINILKNVPVENLKKKTNDMVNTFNEENKLVISKYLIKIIENIVEKELLYNIVSHQILLDACELLKEEELINIMDIIHEGCEHLISTNLGNKALILLLGYSTNKHKKILIKTLKNDIIELCKNSVNFLLIIRLLKITDDTTVLNQYIVRKIANNFETVFNDYYGFYVILEFFYDINQYKENKYFHVEWKNIIYAKPVKSIKDGEKRKTEIIQPIVDQLQILFQNKDKLNEYLKGGIKYMHLIFEFLQYTKNENIINNLLFVVEQYIHEVEQEAKEGETKKEKEIEEKVQEREEIEEKVQEEKKTEEKMQEEEETEEKVQEEEETEEKVQEEEETEEKMQEEEETEEKVQEEEETEEKVQEEE